MWVGDVQMKVPGGGLTPNPPQKVFLKVLCIPLKVRAGTIS
jgi:hypothetical protein